jgi:hypothetical protein
LSKDYTGFEIRDVWSEIPDVKFGTRTVGIETKNPTKCNAPKGKNILARGNTPGKRDINKL